MPINPATGIDDPFYAPPSTPGATTTGATGLIDAPATTTTPATPAPTSTTPNTPVYGAPTTQGWNVTDQQTVEGRVKGLIDANSPLMQQAATTGLQQANARGLANSSMAVGASQAEVLKAAVPIATADANIQANAIDPNKQLQINSSEKVAKMNIDADLNKWTADMALRKDLSAAEIAARKDQLVTEIASREGISTADRVALSSRLDTELASRERIATLENDTRVQLAGKDNEYKLLISNNQGAASLYDTYQKAINAINTSELDAANKQKALDDQFAILQAGMGMYRDVESLNLDGIIGTVDGGVQGGDGWLPPEPGGTLPGAPVGPGANPGGGTDAIAASELASRQSAWDTAIANLGPAPVWDDTANYEPNLAAWNEKVAALGPRPT